MTQEARVLSAVANGAQTCHAVSTVTGLSVNTASAVLSQLRVRGRVVKVGARASIRRSVFVYQVAVAVNNAVHSESQRCDQSPSNIRTINGVEYQVVNDCSGPVTAAWPDGHGGSSLAPGYFTLLRW